MTEKDFALAIVTDYINAWSKFTQRGIARCVRVVTENGPEAAIIRDHNLPNKRKYLERMLPRQFEEMKRQIREGDETQVRKLVDWVRKEKIWEKEHGFDGPPEDEVRRLLPWMQGAKVNPRQENTGQGTSSYTGGWLKEDYGSWAWGNLYCA